MEKRYIPKYLNAEPQILWWDLSEFITVLVFVAFGLLANFPFIMALLGVVTLRMLTKLKGHKEPGFMKHWFYGKGLYGLKGRVPDFWIRELVR